MPQFTFGSSRRLKNRASFRRVSREGEKVVARHFLFLIAPAEEPHPAAPGASDPLPRLGITASKKVGNSVVRSRAKRITREVFRRNPDFFAKGSDLVIICRPGVEKLSYGEAEQEWYASRKKILAAEKRLQKRTLRKKEA